MGRLSRAKGVDLFVKAVRGMPTDGRLEVRIHGIVQSEEERLFEREIRRMAASDARICFLDPLPGDHVLSALSQWDALCVPSRVQDMRPQVILEAFSVGVPVIGAALGGIPDLIEDGHNGLLFPPNDAEALRKLLLKVTREPSLLQGLRQKIPQVQTIESLASFMADRYLSVRSRYNRQSS
jgi:glycosyltransferase involved in cell wall biosynthesis